MNNFSKLADELLNQIVEIIEIQDKEGFIDIDFNNDILNLHTEKGIFVINKHSAAREIWLASPISGPHHFVYNENGHWLSKAGNDLIQLIETELSIKVKF